MRRTQLSAKLILLEGLLRDLSNTLADLACVVNELRCQYPRDRLEQARADLEAVEQMAGSRGLPPHLEYGPATSTGAFTYEPLHDRHPEGER